MVPILNLLAGLGWIAVALRNFDRLGFLNVYHLREYRGLRGHGGDVLLPCVAGLLFLIGAAVGLLRANRGPKGAPDPVVTTLFSPTRDSAPQTAPTE